MQTGRTSSGVGVGKRTRGRRSSGGSERDWRLVRRGLYFGAMPKIRLTGLLAALLLAGCGSPTAVPTAAPAAGPVPSPSTTLTAGQSTPLPPTAVPTAAVPPMTTSPTPEASPTPEPSPTPALYTVVEGDTAVAVADRFAITLADLQAVNPGIDLSLIQIGQQLTLPPGSVVSPPTETAAPAAAVGEPQLSVIQLQRYPTPLDSVWFLGELRNDGAQPVADATVELNVDGTLTIIWLTTPLVLPGATAPFGLLVQDADPTAPAEAVVRSGLTTNTAATRFAQLTLSEVQFTQLDGPVSLEGVVTNQTDTAVDSITLTASLYAVDDVLSGYQILKLDGTLAAGASRPFRMTTTPPGDTPVRYSLQALGLRAGQ